MDIELRQSIIEQERHKLEVVKRISVDPQFDDEMHERAAMYATAIQLYINAIVILTEKQSIFEDAFTWANDHAAVA